MNSSAFRIAIIAALALLSGVLIVAAAWILARGDGNAPIQVIEPSSASATEPPQIGGGGALMPTPPTPPEPDLRVYINGAVQNPGVYPLQPGDRLVDALAAAGGATANADLTSINLAQRVRDEGYYYLPQEGETPPPIAALPAQPGPPQESNPWGGAQPDNPLIDVNTASADALATLPTIGPVKAQAIVAYRDQNGPFASIEEIIEVSGIGPLNYETIRDLVTVSPP
ncbi:MAG TPA: helix-hairpin-helix domain-containing protein [Dehalococcoidia bacterium]|nr:helix-hairpin-helix domain-containing protein [Dehalococcoidia bacterium]